MAYSSGIQKINNNFCEKNLFPDAWDVNPWPSEINWLVLNWAKVLFTYHSLSLDFWQRSLGSSLWLQSQCCTWTTWHPCESNQTRIPTTNHHFALDWNDQCWLMRTDVQGTWLEWIRRPWWHPKLLSSMSNSLRSDFYLRFNFPSCFDLWKNLWMQRHEKTSM